MSIGITKEQEMVLMIKGLISDLTPAQQDEVFRIVAHLRDQANLEKDGVSVGKLAFALVGAEMSV